MRGPRPGISIALVNFQEISPLLCPMIRAHGPQLDSYAGLLPSITPTLAQALHKFKLGIGELLWRWTLVSTIPFQSYEPLTACFGEG